MAIKVIKHGKKPKFKKTCLNCGCEFEYEQEDLVTDYNWNLTGTSLSYPRRIRRVIICPDCGERLLHDMVIDQDWYPPTITYTTNLSTWPDCATCPNRPDPNKPAQVGDTPCTWCIKNRPYCTTGAVTAATNTNDVKVITRGNSQKADFTNLNTYISYTNAKSQEVKEEKNITGFSPEDIDLPQ